MEAFFRSARRPSRPSEWTLEDAARFAALKEGYLLQFLSENKKAFATARRLGLPLLQSQPLPPSAAKDGQQRRRVPRSTSASVPPARGRANASGNQRAGSTRPASQSPMQPPTSASAPATSAAPAVGTGRGAAEASCSSGDTSEQRPNSAKRRSAERSARRHARRQRVIRCQVLAVLYFLKLRRRARRRRDLQDLSELSDVPEPASKRDRGSSSTSEPSPPSSESDLEGPPCCMGIAMVPRCEHSNGLRHEWWVCSLCEQRKRRDLPPRSSTRPSTKRASVGWPGSLQR
jgi:hypothetical protein